MLKKITFIDDITDPAGWVDVETDDLLASLWKHYGGKWPDGARLFHEHVSAATDITPIDPDNVRKLAHLDGRFFVVEYPETGVEIFWYAVVFLAGIAAVTLLSKVPPSPTLRNTTAASPNNELSDRVNRPRPNGRIPDILGQVRSTPDLIAAAYTVFIGNREVEYSVGCIGRGSYLSDDERDGDTLFSTIAGAGLKIFGPHTSPNGGGAPQKTIGAAFTEPIYEVTRVTAVNGQVLRAPNSGQVTGNAGLKYTFEQPNKIKVASEYGVDFTNHFQSGDALSARGFDFSESFNVNASVRFYPDGSVQWEEIPGPPAEFEVGSAVQVFGATFTGESSVFDLNGTYVVEFVDLDNLIIQFSNPNAVNPQWALIPDVFSDTKTTYVLASLKIPAGPESYDLSGDYVVDTVAALEITLIDPEIVNDDWEDFTGTTPAHRGLLSTLTDGWVGPFIIDSREVNHVWNNLVASGGLYKDDGTQQFKLSVTVRTEITPVDDDGDPTGAATNYDATLEGSATNTETKALTQKIPYDGLVSVRMKRLTDTDFLFAGQVTDEVRWRDLYAVVNVPTIDFGDVTLYQSLTLATAGALNVKERKTNMRVTRLIPARIGTTSTFTEELFPSKNAADIFCFAALDPRIGGRSVAELDVPQIYDTIAAVAEYFDTDEAAQFCYTLDADNISFEDTAAMIAEAVFCTAYRRGAVIRLQFEKETDDSSLLFNHRNKVPKTEKRTYRFGSENDIDGIAFSYVDPRDDAIVTLYIPEDRSAVKEKRIESVGIRSHRQAHFHARRAWNKARYQNILVTFSATAEAQLLVRRERILVADNTRQSTQDGEVMTQDGLLLTLSQPAAFEDGEAYTMWLQLPDATVQAVTVAPTSNNRQVTISTIPAMPLVLDRDRFARTTYMITKNSSQRQTAFLMTERGPVEDLIAEVSAVNYDARYYQNDFDYRDGVIE